MYEEDLITNGLNGAYGSGGSMNNPMYRNIHSDGCYEHLSGRYKRRLYERINRKEEKVLDYLFGLPKKKKNLKGFGR
jgi:hypothetical protein